MNYYNLIGTLCLLFWVDLCFAQRLTQPARGHFGVYSYHYLAREYATSLQEGTYTITPLRTQVGLTGEWSLGDHFGLGMHVSYYRRKAQGLQDFRDHTFYYPIEYYIIDYDYHNGVFDVYARWYPQNTSKPLRYFMQLNLGTLIAYGGSTAYPFHPDPSFKETQALGFDIGNNYSVALGGGLQYRLTDKWRMDTAIMLNFPTDNKSKPFFFMQYGLQVGIYRINTKKKS